MIPANKTVGIYYLVDEFLKEYDAVIIRRRNQKLFLGRGNPKEKEERQIHHVQ